MVLWANGTQLSPGINVLLSRFGTVWVNVSFDGYGELNDYIRYPSCWNDVTERVRLLAESGVARVRIVPVLQAYNILKVTELFTWARDLGYAVDVNTVNGAPHLDYRIMPEPARRLAATRLEA